MRHDTRCDFHVRSKADISQLNLRTIPTTNGHDTRSTKIGRLFSADFCRPIILADFYRLCVIGLISKKRICSEVSVNSTGNRGVSPENVRQNTETVVKADDVGLSISTGDLSLGISRAWD